MRGLGIALCVAACACGASQPESAPVEPPAAPEVAEEPPPDPYGLGERLDRVIRERHIPGIAVAVIDGDRVVTAGMGLVDRSTNVIPTGDTVFPIGSVTKTFTALLLADAVERGELKYEDRLADFFPGVRLAKGVGDITLASLASQSSGLPRLPPNLGARNPRDPYASYSLERLEKALGKTRLIKPGTYRYSNFGYGVLERVLEVATGRSYGDLLHERIAWPLGMRATGLVEGEDATLARGYNEKGNPTPHWHWGGLGGAGALKSTAADLARFVRAQTAPEGLGLEAAMRATHEARGAYPGGEIGLAWHIQDGDVRWHNGQTFGFSSFVGFSPTRRVGVVVLINQATSAADELGSELLVELMKSSDAPGVAERSAAK